MSNHTVAVTSAASLVPVLRRSGLYFFGALALGAALRFFDGAGDQVTALLWMVVASGVGGVLWAGIARERH